MKKILIMAMIILVLGSCSTYYGKYDYNSYFQNNEPYVVVDSEEEAAAFIARKLAKQFRHTHRQTLSVLAFTDEYGDRINRGDFFARMVIAEMTRYNNPIIVERESLYELIKERELSMTNLIDNEGYELEQLLQADYILHGRILRGKDEDMISVRCFEVGTGQVVYASTISIDYTPDPIYVPVPVPPPHGPGHHPKPPSEPGTTTGTTGGSTVGTTPVPTSKKEPNTKPTDGTTNIGKIDLNDQKKTTPDNYKKKTTPTTTTDKNTPTTTPTTTVKKTKTTIKSTPEKITVIPVAKEPEPVINKPIQNETVKEEPAEEKKEEAKKTTTSSTTKKKSSTIKK